MTSPVADAADRYAAFRHRPYALYFLSRFFETFAMEVISVSVGWQVYDITREPFDLGLIGLTQFMPALLLTLVTGTIADQFGRRAIMIVCEFVSLGCAIALVLFTFAGLSSVLPIFAVLVVLGVSRAFFGPASQSLAPNLVPEQDLPNAIAWNSTSWQTASIVGPVAGGLLYGVSAMTPYVVSLVLFAGAVLAVAMVPKPAQKTKRQVQSWQTLSAGFRYISREKIVLGAISLDMFAVLLGGAVALMPVFARDVLHLGPWGLGMLRAGPGIGAICMAMVLTARPIRRGAGHAMLIAVAVFGAGTIVFGLSKVVWLSVAALIAMGAADMISVYVRQTLIQLWTPDELRGRVSAVNQVFVGASNELGEFRAGGMAALIGAVPAVVIGGFGTLAVAGLWAILFPKLRRIQALSRQISE